MDEDPNLDGEIAETPTTSPVETITPDEGSQVNQNGAETQSVEEATWNSLKGNSQARFKEVLRDLNAERARREQIEAENRRLAYGGGVPTIPSLQQSALNPEVQAGIKQLSDMGLATKDEVAQTVENTVNQRLSGVIYNMEMDRLSSRHNGADGLPAFDKEEYEDYITRYPQYRNYTPEDVYSKMYEDDIFDVKVSRMEQPAATRQSASLKPTKTRVQEEPLSLELIEQRLREPDGRQWYERNIDKINAVVSRKPSAE